MKSFDYAEWSYRNYLQDRSVLIVGGSPKVKVPPGDYEVVIRINNHMMSQSGACDVLYHSCVPSICVDLASHIGTPSFVFLNLVDDDFNLGLRAQPLYLDFLCEVREHLPMTDIGFFAQAEWAGSNPYGKQYEWLNDLHKRYDTKLFTGLVALAHVLRFAPSSVTVVGMDMYIDQTKGKLVNKIESHGLVGNLIFLRDARRDPRVCFDKQLTEALKAYGII